MQAKTIILAAAFAAFGSAVLAQEATPDTWTKAASTMSCAQVAEELKQARADGTLHAVSDGYDFSRNLRATKSRAEVRAELIAARESGELAAINAEVQDFRTVARVRGHATPTLASSAPAR